MGVHDRAIATAQKLLAKHGRSVTFVQFDQDLADTDYPWEGPADPTGSPESTLVANAVFVPPASREEFGLHLDAEQFPTRTEAVLLVAPGESFDVKTYHQVLDGSTRYRITFSETFKPGEQVIFAFVGVRR